MNFTIVPYYLDEDEVIDDDELMVQPKIKPMVCLAVILIQKNQCSF